MSGDPEYDFWKHDVKAEEWLESRPVCTDCHQAIQEEVCFDIPKVGKICQKCMNDYIFFIG